MLYSLKLGIGHPRHLASSESKSLHCTASYIAYHPGALIPGTILGVLIVQNTYHLLHHKVLLKWWVAMCWQTDLIHLSKFVTGFEKTWLPHKQYQAYVFTRNGLLAQYTIIFHCWPCSKETSLVSVAAFPRPCVSLEWHFGAIRWSWLSCIGAWRAGQAMKGWPMSVIFNLECCEHKKGPVAPQTGPLAFNCLHIPFCTPILSPPSSSHPPPL